MPGVTNTELRAVLTLQDQMSSRLGAAEAALGRLGGSAKGTTSFMGQLAAGAAASGRQLSSSFVAGAGGAAKQAGALGTAGTAAGGSLGNLGAAAQRTGQALQGVSGASAQAASAAQRSGASFGQMAGSIALGTIAANAIMSALSAVAGAATGAAGGIINLSSRLEQARIGFTTMLGSAQKADQFIGQLQAKAESTAFNFPGIQQVAQSFLAMGIDAKNVIPIIDDVSNALSAAGHGGDTDRLQRVGQSLSEIAAAGKISGEQIRELSRNGIAVLPLLAEAFGKTTAEVRKMAEANEISASMFFEAFHSQVALHYGDIQAQQAKTWAVAASNVGDILGRLSTETFAELTQALTAGALAVNDFLHSEGFAQWAADVKASIHEVMAALAPLGVAIREALGLPGQAAAAPAAKVRPATSLTSTGAGARDVWSVPTEAITSAAEYDAKIKEATASVHGLTEQLTEAGAKQQVLKDQIEDIKNRYSAMQDALKAKQNEINTQIEATKTKWEGVLDPLQRTESQLQRLAEDTKTSFATILDPLKTQLDGVNRKIADSKAAYEATVKPIEAQISAIDKANTALIKQKNLVVAIADLALRQKALNALGDPNLRADIASKLKTLELSDADLDRKQALLELDNKKGRNGKAIASVQKQLDANKRQEIALDQQLADAANKKLLVQVAGQTVLNDAKKEQTAIDLANAQIATDAAKAPLEQQLAAAKAQLATLLDPLELQAAGLSRTIEDVGRAEAAALKPITDALTGTSRQIQDANQSLKDELKPLEDAAKGVAAELAANAIAQAAELAPIEAKSQALDRHSNSLDLQKRQLADQINQWKDAKEQIKEVATEAGKVAKALDLSGGKEEPFPVLPGGLEGPVAPKVGTSFLPPQFLADIHAIAEGARDLGAAFHTADGAATTLTLALGTLGLALGIGGAMAILTGLVIQFDAAILGIGAAITGGLPALGLLGEALGLTGAAFGGLILAIAAVVVALTLYATNFAGFRDTVNQIFTGLWASIVKVFTDMGDNLGKAVALILRDSREGGSNPFPQMGAWFSSWPGTIATAVNAVVAVFTGLGTNLKAAVDLMLRPASAGGSNPFPDLQAAFDGFKNTVTPTVAAIVKAIDPLAAVLNSVADAISHMPQSIPAWLGGLIATIRGGGGGGGGFQQTSLRTGGQPERGAIGGDAMSLSRGGSADLQGDQLLSYVFQKFRDAFGEEGGRVAAAVAQTEGGLFGARGDNNQSAGVFQFYGGPEGGQLNNFAKWLNTSLEDAANVATNRPDLAVQFALENYLGKTIQAGLAAGLTGPELATYVQRFGQVSVSPERAGQSYNTLFGSGGSLPQTTVDLSGGVSGGGDFVRTANNWQQNLPQPLGPPPGDWRQNLPQALGPPPGNWKENLQATQQLTQAQQVMAQADAAAAEAHRRYNEIMTGGTPAITTTATQTQQLGTVQQKATDWAKVFAQQQLALTQTLEGQAPAMRGSKDAMAAFGAVLGPIERQVAGGSIGLETLEFKLVDLARATGIATKPWEMYSAGLIGIDQAMEMVINQASDAGPQFDELRKHQNDAGRSTRQNALDFLQLALNYKSGAADIKGATAVVTAAGADIVKAASSAFATVGKAPALPASTTASIDVLSNAWDRTKAATDLATTSAQTYQGQIDKLDASKINEQRDAWQADTDAVGKLSDGLHNLADFLDGHEFHVKVKVDDIPDWATPGSPTPFQRGLEGIGRAADALRGKRVSLVMPSPAQMRDQLRAQGRADTRRGITPTPLLSRVPLARVHLPPGHGGVTNHYHITIEGNVTSENALLGKFRDGLIKHGRRNGGRVLE